MKLGDLIHEYRVEHGMSMAAFAEAAELSKSYVGFLEKNYNPSTGNEITPSAVVIEKVAEVINISFEELYNMLDEDSRPQLVQYDNTVVDTSDRKKLENKTKIEPSGKNNRLAERRKALGLIAERVALPAGISIAKLYYYERIDPAKIPRGTLSLLASNLAVSEDYLLGLTDEVPSARLADHMFLTDEKEIIRLYRLLNEVGKGRLLGQLELMVEDSRYKK